jgi:hypothetical protein
MSRVDSNRSNIVRNSSSVTGFVTTAGEVALGGSVTALSFHISSSPIAFGECCA